MVIKNNKQKGFIEKCFRLIRENEIVFDVENPNNLKSIVNKMDKWGWKYSILNTSGYGYRIYLLLDRNITLDEKNFIISKLEKEAQSRIYFEIIKLRQEIDL